MTPTNDEREQMMNELCMKWLGSGTVEINLIGAYECGFKDADANPKPVGDFREMAEELLKGTRYYFYVDYEERVNEVSKALSRVAAETEARVRAETIEECAAIAEEWAEGATSADSEDRCFRISEEIYKLASNRSREGGK